MLMVLGRASGHVVRTHWAIESMHWGLDVNLQQDRIRRRYGRAARNLDTIQRILLGVFNMEKTAQKEG
jgi:predicted transposase YbfD/YdcC